MAFLHRMENLLAEYETSPPPSNALVLTFENFRTLMGILGKYQKELGAMAKGYAMSEARLENLEATAKPVIENQRDLFSVSSCEKVWAVFLTEKQIDALRSALAAKEV